MPTPRWDQFLTDTFGDDAEGREMIRYLHLLLGYSITGDVGAQILAFLYGMGKNGKSVLLDVIVKLLGDYADAAPPGFLMAKQFEGHPTDLAELHGRRVIVCSELKAGDRFDESRVKLLTGGDIIKRGGCARTSSPSCPPQAVPARQPPPRGRHRRLRLLAAHAPGALRTRGPRRRKVDNLADILVREEGPGILAWLVDGAARYLAGEKDLTGPERVRVATTAYAETEDHMGRFLSENCKIEAGLRAEQKHLYLAYTRWCEAEGATPVSSRAFAGRVRETLGMTSPKQMATSNSKKYYPASA